MSSHRLRALRPWLLALVISGPAIGVWSLWAPVTEAQEDASSAETSDRRQEVMRQLREARQGRLAMDFPRALAALDQAAETAAGEPRLSARVGLERAAVLGHSGALGRALVTVEDTLEVLRQAAITDGPLLRKALERLAEVNNALGQDAAADSALERAEQLIGADDPERKAALESLRSRLYVHRGSFEQALRAGQRAVELLEAEENEALTVSPLSNVAYALQRLGRFREAEAQYQTVIDRAFRAGDQYAVEFAYCNRAACRRRRGQVAPAISDLQHAIEGFEKARSRVVGSAEERATFLGRQVTAYDRLILYAAETRNGRLAFETAERFHGRSFLELLDSETRLAAAHRRPGMAELERPVLDRMAEIHLLLARQEQDSGALRTELRRLESELWRLEAKWQSRAPVEAAWVAPRLPSLPEIQSRLEAGEALISYWQSDDRLLIWAVSRDRLRTLWVPVGRQKLRRSLERFLEPLRSPGRARELAGAGEEQAHLELGRRLHSWLIDPLPAFAKDAERWILVPDGVLHNLPFGALPSSCAGDPTVEAKHAPYSGCSFLGLDKAMSYVPSAGVLMSLRDRQQRRAKPASDGLLVLAPDFQADPRTGNSEPTPTRALGPLPFSAEEARRVGAWFAESEVLRRDQATESMLQSSASRFRFLHLATHGVVDDQFPLGSGVLLKADSANDGLLQVSEVVALDLRADLVTLSACRTGRGRLSRGEGIIGLGQAFLFAGASSLVLSMWDVDDKVTMHLMDAFYRGLSSGADPAEALRLARRQIFANSEQRRWVFGSHRVSFAHPRFWAAFVVIGDPP